MKLHLQATLEQKSTIIRICMDSNQVFFGNLDQHVLAQCFNCFEHQYPALTLPSATTKFSVQVLEGQIAIGSALIWVDDFTPRPGFYTQRKNRNHVPGSDIDHRDNIRIDEQPPAWPTSDSEYIPKGTPEHPNWNGWFFSLSAGQYMTFDIAWPYWPESPHLPFCLGDASNNNLQWYDADGNAIDSDPLGEEFWLARQNQVDQ